ncbi:tetratricopeptide repeat protein [Nannocystis pusilla]|uniref:Tetratricopeptide repeat protein n=1 Tax=Nannocystis pusilla TaxID=889268 RepID=A0ABS7U276_9BACT|nr:tetratricopeptide repeat protein [Nannocystis pusilla]MBZ5714558.1 tetratricopeptide repeat protein [Nannocystis pusilla]
MHARLTASLLLAAGLAGCKPPAPAAPAVVLDPSSPEPTPAGDLPLLRQKAAMGLVDVVRAELGPRLADAGDAGPDPGRDALRAFAIELALRQDDQPAALQQLQVLARDLDRLGPRASGAERARWLILHGALLCAQQRYAEARGQSLEALAAIDLAREPGLAGDAFRGLAREQLALGQPDRALTSVRRAMAVHKDSLAVFEDGVLAVDILIAAGEPLEAVIAAGKLYDDAIAYVGPSTLAHAEALAAAAAATFASGDRDASSTFFADASKIWGELQATRSDLRLPLSARLERRLGELAHVLERSAPAPAEPAPKDRN